jgi:Protein of unknown function (DUF1501)
VVIATRGQKMPDHARILHLMELDHELLSYFHQGRDETLIDVGGRVVREIIA